MFYTHTLCDFLKVLNKSIIIGRATLVGIVSFGNGCAHEQFPGVYLRVSSVMSWIQARSEGSFHSNCNGAYPGPQPSGEMSPVGFSRGYSRSSGKGRFRVTIGHHWVTVTFFFSFL